MLSTGSFFQAMVPLYMMAVIGFAGRRMKILNSNANQVITQLMLYITLPALILYSLNTSFSHDLLTDFSWLVTMSIFILSVSVVAGAWLSRKASLPLKQKSVYESFDHFWKSGIYWICHRLYINGRTRDYLLNTI